MRYNPAAIVLVAGACVTPALAQPSFSANDFSCFLQRYVAGDPYANCDGSTATPTLTANDFTCFLNAYVRRDSYADCDATAPGWTQFPLPAGASVFYVSSSTGDDSNPGTLALPFRSISRGVAALQNGRADQLLLRCGDTWTNEDVDVKSSGSTSAYMLIGSYGTGPRPRILDSGQIFYATGAVVGLAFVGLHMEKTGPLGGGLSPLFFTHATKHVLIEDCYITRWAVGIPMHEINAGVRLTDIKIRRNVIYDSDDNDTRSGGVFFGSVDGLVMEENLLDKSGFNIGEPNTNGHHNVYIHETCGAAVFNGNISARANSHGLQQRPGGQCVNNLFLDNAINCFVGDSANVQNLVQHNVVQESHDISPADRRGQGFELGGRGVVRYNIVAHQTRGTESVVGFGFSGFDSGTVEGNYLIDWESPANPDAVAIQWDGGFGKVSVLRNRFYQSAGAKLVFHASRFYSNQFTYRENAYSSGQAGAFTTGNGHGWITWSQWQSRETNSTFTTTQPSVDLTMRAYLITIGVEPGTDAIATFLAHARQQSRQNWDPAFTSDAFNDWARSIAGVEPN